MRAMLSPDVLTIEPRREAERLSTAIADVVFSRLRRRGVVVGLSGGVDSSVVAALCVRALGRDRVMGLLMPEKDSAPESSDLATEVAKSLGISTSTEDISEVLEAAGCYRRRDEAVSALIPGYTSEWRMKVVSPGVLERGAFRTFLLVVEDPSGRRTSVRPPPDIYRAIVAATNFKQRTRKMFEYHHADRLGYAVAGTPNRLEYDQGFFVKGGDGAADFKPIAHLYKSQVYQLARCLGLPDEVTGREPTTDTYTLSQSQEEFFFSLPYEKMDLFLYARSRGLAPDEVSIATGLSTKQVSDVFSDIDRKRRWAEYLHLPPVLFDEAAAGGMEWGTTAE